MKLSDYVMEFLRDRDVNVIFGYIGGSLLYLIDSLNKTDGLRYIQNYHEQASAFCADAYSRVNGNIGVAMATSGPGATNLITGIANAFFDSVPCLFITGQVSIHHMKIGWGGRQEGFQETDIQSIAKPITKFAKTVLQPEMIRFYLEKAFYCAKSGRPGPVLLDIPHNVQASEIDPDSLCSFFDSDEHASEMKRSSQLNLDAARQIAALIPEAKRPVVLAGGGVSSMRSSGILKKFVNAYDLPVVCSLMGLGAIDHYDKHYCGFIGSYGNRYANMAVARSDLLLVLGSRLDARQTGDARTSFARGARIVHIDIDPHELNHNIPESISICCEIKVFLEALLEEIWGRGFSNAAWFECINSWKANYPSYPGQNDPDYLDPNEFLHTLSQKLSTDAIICSDVGQNQMWVAQSLCVSGKKQLLNSGGHGAMGYSLPAGIGAYFAAPDREIVCIVGDGGIQMNLQEFQTISRERIPAKIFILNNQSLGMVRVFQEKYFDNRCIGTVEGYTNPDFEKLAYAFNVKYSRISAKQDVDRIDDGLACDGPCVFEVVLSPLTQVLPEPMPGRAVEDQFPLLDRAEFDRIMNSGENGT